MVCIAVNYAIMHHQTHTDNESKFFRSKDSCTIAQCKFLVADDNHSSDLHLTISKIYSPKNYLCIRTASALLVS